MSRPRRTRRILLDVALDLPAAMLPALAFLSATTYTAWYWWWV